MSVYPQFVPDPKLDASADDPDGLTIVNNNDHPVKLPFGGTLQPGHWFRLPVARLFRSSERP